MKKLPSRSVQSGAPKSEEDTIDALETIQSFLSGQRLISQEEWALSLVKSKGKQHAFLVTEGRVQNKFIILRTDLFL
nr:hypothetical protein [Pseudomonadota bacterium]